MSALERAITKAGGITALAERIGGNVKPQHIVNWRKRGVPPGRCADIERATGGEITRADLLPELFGDPKPKRARRRAEARA